MTRTIFLSTDGRHVTLGRGVDHEPADIIAAEVRALGHRGFIAVLTGDYWDGRPVELTRRGEGIDACASEWDAAVSRFLDIRAGH